MQQQDKKKNNNLLQAIMLILNIQMFSFVFSSFHLENDFRISDVDEVKLDTYVVLKLHLKLYSVSAGGPNVNACVIVRLRCKQGNSARE